MTEHSVHGKIIWCSWNLFHSHFCGHKSKVQIIVGVNIMKIIFNKPEEDQNMEAFVLDLNDWWWRSLQLSRLECSLQILYPPSFCRRNMWPVICGEHESLPGRETLLDHEHREWQCHLEHLVNIYCWDEPKSKSKFINLYAKWFHGYIDSLIEKFSSDRGVSTIIQDDSLCSLAWSVCLTSNHLHIVNI